MCRVKKSRVAFLQFQPVKIYSGTAPVNVYLEGLLLFALDSSFLPPFSSPFVNWPSSSFFFCSPDGSWPFFSVYFCRPEGSSPAGRPEFSLVVVFSLLLTLVLPSCLAKAGDDVSPNVAMTMSAGTILCNFEIFILSPLYFAIVAFLRELKQQPCHKLIANIPSIWCDGDSAISAENY